MGNNTTQSKPRIAWFSPLGGTLLKTEIFTREVLPLLGRTFDIELFGDSEDCAQKGYEVHHYLRAFVRHEEAPFSHFIYQLEDHPRCLFVRHALALHPGVVIAHDLELPRLDRESGIEDEERRILLARQVTTARHADEDEHAAGQSSDWRRKAAGYLVQNEHAVSLLRPASGARSLGITSYPVAERGATESLEAARANLGIEAGAFVAGFAGTNRFEERSEMALRAFQRFAGAQADTKAKFLWLVTEEGRAAECRKLTDKVLDEPLRQLVRIEELRSYEKLRTAIAACDVFLGMQFSLFSSRSLAHSVAIGMGVPVVSSDFGPSSELPTAIAPLIPVGLGEEEICARLLGELAARPELRRELSLAVSSYAELIGTPEGVAYDIEVFLTRCATGMSHLPSPVRRVRRTYCCAEDASAAIVTSHERRLDEARGVLLAGLGPDLTTDLWI